MAFQIRKPGPNDDCRELWRIVADCTEVVNAIANMKVLVEGQVKMQGQLSVTGQSSKLEIKEAKEVEG